MKRKATLLFCLSFAIACPSFGQKEVSSMASSFGNFSVPKGKSREETLFREALSKGREYRDYYVLVNESQKMVKEEDLIDICKAHDYLYSDKYVKKDIDRFGDKASTVYKFEFLPKAVFPEYVFDWTDRTSTKFADLKSKGSAWVFDVNLYNASNKMYLKDNCLWSGSVADGMIEGTGTGFCHLGETQFLYFFGQFRKGFPIGRVMYSIFIANEEGDASKNAQFHLIEVGEIHDGMALFRYLSNGGDKRGKANELYGYVSEEGKVTVMPTYKTAHDFSGDKAAVKNDKGLDVYINKYGTELGYTEAQQKVFDDAKAEEERIKAEAERQKLLAEQKAEEERQLAEEKRRAYLQKIQPLMDKSKWQIGDRLCLEFARQGQYITGTLEGWNPDRSKCKLMIVTSPGARVRYNGYNLEKNNVVWIPTSGDGWHKALPEEIEAANRDDNSTYSNSISTLAKCPECNGKGYVEYTYKGWFGSTGTGTRTCSRCEGTKFVMMDQKLF